MTGSCFAAIVLVILLGCSTLGLLIRPLLSEGHRSREAAEFVQLVLAMLMTFVALVLGLLTSSVKSSFDKVSNDVRGLAIQLIQLDHSLHEWGAETQATRELLRTYTATSIATTWTREPKPPGDALYGLDRGHAPLPFGPAPLSGTLQRLYTPDGGLSYVF